MLKSLIFILLEQPLWQIAILFTIFCCLFFLYMTFKIKDPNEKRFMLGFSMFYLNFAIVRIFYYIKRFTVEENTQEYFLFGDYYTIIKIFEIVSLNGTIFGLIGGGLIFLIFESVLKHTKYLLTLVSLFFLQVTLIVRSSFLAQTFLNVYSLLMILILIWFSENSSAKFQTISAFLMINQILMLFAVIISMEGFNEINAISPLFSPLFIILGAFISIVPFFINPLTFSSSAIHWFYLFIANLFLFCFGSYLIFIMRMSLSILIVLFTNAFIMLYAGYRIYDYKQTINKTNLERSLLEKISKSNKPKIIASIKKVRFAKEGFYLIFSTSAFLILLIFNLPNYYFLLWKIIFAPIFFGLTIFFLFFFRDFKRIAENVGGITSPADGQIFQIENSNDCYSFYIGMRMRNVHTQKSPIAGKIVDVKRLGGSRYKIYLAIKSNKHVERAKEKNARAIIKIQEESGDIAEVTQICGAWARRARPCVKLNQYVHQGEKLGIIMFGSLVKFTIPQKGRKLNVNIGDKVKGGKSVLLL